MRRFRVDSRAAMLEEALLGDEEVAVYPCQTPLPSCRSANLFRNPVPQAKNMLGGPAKYPEAAVTCHFCLFFRVRYFVTESARKIEGQDCVSLNTSANEGNLWTLRITRFTTKKWSAFSIQWCADGSLDILPPAPTPSTYYTSGGSQVKKVIAPFYKTFLAIFKYYCLTPSTSVRGAFSIQPNQFGKMMQDAEFAGNFISVEEIGKIFVLVNFESDKVRATACLGCCPGIVSAYPLYERFLLLFWSHPPSLSCCRQTSHGALLQRSADADVNEDRALMRFELIEALIRVAITMRDNEGQDEMSPAEKVRPVVFRCVPPVSRLAFTCCMPHIPHGMMLCCPKYLWALV